jgi:3-mercaptopyruvate sulfurtransferase SseA
VQCDPYEQERYLPEVLGRTGGAEKVIVYCGGGDCQDSIFMCRDLIMQGVSFDSVYLFEGGWKEWEANQMPVEKNE